MLDLTDKAVGDGLDIRAQVAPQPVGVLLGLQGSRNPFSTLPDGDPDHMVSIMYSSKGARTVSKYSSEKMDALIQQGRTETNIDKRKAIYCEIERLVSEDAILIMPIRLVSHIIAQKKVRNIPPPRGNIVQVNDIWLEDPQRD